MKSVKTMPEVAKKPRKPFPKLIEDNTGAVYLALSKSRAVTLYSTYNVGAFYDDHNDGLTYKFDRDDDYLDFEGILTLSNDE